jgi:tRNA pseudouridine55 synthase
VATDTLDADGSETARMDMEVSRADLERIRPRFLGAIDQVPPMVSALKKDGTRLYELARQGVEVEREPRPVVIHELEILTVGDGPQPLVSFRVRCGKGTYVRALADDMARALGGYAHLTSLRRTRTGHLTLDQAVDDLAAWADHLVSPADGMAMFPDLNVDEEGARLLRNGRPLGAPEGVTERVRALDSSGRLIAVCTIEGGVARPEVVVG